MNLLRYRRHLQKTLAFLLLFFNLFSIGVVAQQRTYTVANAHAHNDYQHPVPFYTAYNAGFGSIEADIILYNNKLYVAHNIADTSITRTLQILYLDPLQKAIQKNHGYVYADTTKNLLLLIDLKTPAEPTLDALLKLLQHYKLIIGCPRLKIVITGNQPDIATLNSYPSWLFFDGNLGKPYTAETLNKVALFSDDFRKYARWDGTGILADSAGKKIQAAVTKAHRLQKPIRFWAAPDNPNTWSQLIGLNADYINTDRIKEISIFLDKFSSGSLQNK
jgi:alkaline phosphatase